MRSRLSIMLVAFVALSLVLSLVAAVAPGASAQDGTIIPGGPTGGLNKWIRHDLPTTQHWQMAPNTDIWDLESADDGTLFALVEDTSGPIDMILGGAPATTWDGLRWAVFPAYSDVALFKSTDGGYEWKLVWHQPASDVGAPLAVIPQPGYIDGDSANDAVFVATGSRYLPTRGTWVGGQWLGDIYRSLDGGNTFTRVTPRCPAVTIGGPGGSGTITSMDVAEDRTAAGQFVVVVGVMGAGGGGAFNNGNAEGVYTWNEGGDGDWEDKQIANSLPPAPYPGTLPAGNGIHAMQVMFSPGWLENGQIVAVAVDRLGFGGAPIGTYVCFYDATDGTWGGDIDSPTNVAIGTTGDRAFVYTMAIPEDYRKTDNAYVFVGVDATQGPNNIEDVWRIQGLTTVSGPSTATAMSLGAAGGGAVTRIFDIVVEGPAASCAVYVGAEFPAGTPPTMFVGQAQVFRGEQATLWPTWTPSFKPPSGRWPVLLADMGGTLMAAGGGDGFTTSGVHRCAAGCTACAADQRMAFNGVGLMDDIAVSEDIPGYVNPGTSAPLMAGTSWCLAEATAEEVSPMYETDNLMYVSTFSEWSPTVWSGWGGPFGSQYEGSLSLWRWTDSAHWERIMYEEVTLPSSLSPGPGSDQFAGKWSSTDLSYSAILENQWTWWPRVPRGFSEDPYVFLLGGRMESSDVFPFPNIEEMLWYSPDLGDTWIPVSQMPLGAIQNSNSGQLTDTGWWVQDNNIIFLSDYNGWVYKTTDRGASWTEGARTSPTMDINCIITSPVYSETGGEGTDMAVLVAGYDWATDQGAEVWICQDGCVQDLENIGSEIHTDPWWTGYQVGTWVNFDPEWINNRFIYAAATGHLDRWELIGPGATELTRIDFTDVGVYRTQVNLNDPSASTWEQIWGADDFNAVAPKPQPYPGMLMTQDIFRYVILTGVQVGSDGSLYIPVALWDQSYNSMFRPPEPPSPFSPGRYTLGGVLRCLEPTQKNVEWNVVDRGLGEWDGLYLSRAVAGDSNTLISLAWDFQEWRWKLAILDDTLCTEASPTEPSSGDTGAGTLNDVNKVSVTLKWGQMDADVYEWQVDDDCGFVPPFVASGVTSEELVTVTNLEPGVSYCWRARATQPYWSRWSPAQSFSTAIGTLRNAPRLLAPAPGAVTLDTSPGFQWSSIGWADKYQIQVATSSAFGSADIVVNENLGNTQAHNAGDLALGTYYWRVKASSDTSTTEWSSTGAFTISGEAAGEGGTAGWVWVVIIIGILLIILVVVFIMRTSQAA